MGWRLGEPHDVDPALRARIHRQFERDLERDYPGWRFKVVPKDDSAGDVPPTLPIPSTPEEPMSTMSDRTARRTRHDIHGWCLSLDDTRIGYVTHEPDGSWTAKDIGARPIRRGLDRRDDAESFLVGRHLADTGDNDCVVTLAAQLADAVGQINEATARRDELVVAMRNAGATLKAIAEASGLTAGGIHQALGRMTSNRGALRRASVETDR